MKTDVLNIRIDTEFKKELKISADNLGMSMSEILRTSFYSYIDKRVGEATSNMLCRILHYLKETDPNFTLESARPTALKVMADMPLIGLETWGGPGTPEEMFGQFVEMRLASVARKEKEAVTA